MKWGERFFAPIDKNGAYISNAALLYWDVSGWAMWKRHFIMADNIPTASVLYDADRVKIDVEELVNSEWINANMRDKYKNENYELRVYRLTRVDNEAIHVDLAFYDAKKGNWVHELY